METKYKAGDRVLVTIPSIPPFTGIIICRDREGIEVGGEYGIVCEITMELRTYDNSQLDDEMGVYSQTTIQNLINEGFIDEEVGILEGCKPIDGEEVDEDIEYLFVDGQYLQLDTDLDLVVRTIKKEIEINSISSNPFGTTEFFI